MDDITLLEECMIKVEEIKEEVCDEFESMECGMLENVSGELNDSTKNVGQNCFGNVNVKREFCDFVSTGDCDNDSEEEELKPLFAVFLQQKEEIREDTFEKDPLALSEDAGPSVPLKVESKFQNPEVSIPSQQELPALSVETEERRTSESAVRVMQGLPAESADPHACSPATRLLHTTPCPTDLSGPSGRDSQIPPIIIQYRYQHCNSTFTQMSQLNQHQLSTNCKLKPSKSTDCNEASANRSRLIEHKRTQIGLKPYKCLLCNYATAQKSQLKDHLRKHSVIKPFKCTECNYTTADNSNLKRHQGIHSGIKPYKCTKCNFTSAQRVNLKRHEQTHSGL